MKKPTSSLIIFFCFFREELECDEVYEFAVNVYLNTNPELASKYISF
jgi:hypothetical protein